MPAIGKGIAKPQTQNADGSGPPIHPKSSMEKPLYTTRWKPVLMFTKAELKKSAALIDGMGPKRTEKIWQSMPFEYTICGAYKGDYAIQYILLKLVESRGLPYHHYHN